MDLAWYDGVVDFIGVSRERRDEFGFPEFGMRLAWRSVRQGTSFPVANIANLPGSDSQQNILDASAVSVTVFSSIYIE